MALDRRAPRALVDRRRLLRGVLALRPALATVAVGGFRQFDADGPELRLVDERAHPAGLADVSQGRAEAAGELDDLLGRDARPEFEREDAARLERLGETRGGTGVGHLAVGDEPAVLHREDQALGGDDGESVEQDREALLLKQYAAVLLLVDPGDAAVAGELAEEFARPGPHAQILFPMCARVFA